MLHSLVYSLARELGVFTYDWMRRLLVTPPFFALFINRSASLATIFPLRNVVLILSCSIKLVTMLRIMMRRSECPTPTL